MPYIKEVSVIAIAYVRRNPIPAAMLPHMLETIHSALAEASKSGAADEVEQPTQQEIRDSIGPEFLTSFEDGRRYKVLRRHLTRVGLTPETYRRKWGLPDDYPMVSAVYSRKRSNLARENGLGKWKR